MSELNLKRGDRVKFKSGTGNMYRGTVLEVDGATVRIKSDGRGVWEVPIKKCKRLLKEKSPPPIEAFAQLDAVQLIREYKLFLQHAYKSLYTKVEKRLNSSEKADRWFVTPDPFFGGMMPLFLIMVGRHDKVEQFVDAAIEENKRE